MTIKITRPIRSCFWIFSWVTVATFFANNSIAATFWHSVAQQDSEKKKQDEKPRFVDPSKVDEDYAFQGEYVGEFGLAKNKTGVQVIALGKGQFQFVIYDGGLPGAGWNGETKTTPKEKGKLLDGVVCLDSDFLNIRIANDVFRIESKGGNVLGELNKVQRKSPTLGEKPPEGAVVLFDGSDADGWKNGQVTDDHLLIQGTTSKQEFGSHKIHIEFRLPYMPQDRGQARGNSGIYVQGKYEVQMLDSFGLDGKKNECGGIYSVKDCDLNMCFPPLTWQTYDIEFTAAKIEDGKTTSPPRMTVIHNGVKIHDDVELPSGRSTTAAPVKPASLVGPLFLQNHKCPVRYRNIWVVEQKKD